jgi:Ca-activated chloride channel homolog
MYFFRFANPKIFYIFIPIFILVIFFRFKFYKSAFYFYPLAGFLKKNKFSRSTIHKKVFFILRSLVLLILMFLVARPQWVDANSKIKVEGVDIVLALDVSGSMQVFDDVKDQRSRIEVVKDEAIRFIEKRTNDPIGIVIFAKDAIARCPLTLDKNILKEIVQSLYLGVIDERATSLGTGLASAVNRLRKTKSKSKVIILLTDGLPTSETEQITWQMALAMAKKFGIKIYTVGIGNKDGGYVQTQFGAIMQAGVPLDMKLLTKIAQESGGKAFRAESPKDMRMIYNTIDKLEKTKIETNVFHNYYEAHKIWLWIVLILLCSSIALRLFVWRGISC